MRADRGRRSNNLTPFLGLVLGFFYEIGRKDLHYCVSFPNFVNSSNHLTTNLIIYLNVYIMRRLLLIVLALFAILAPSTIWAYDFEADGIFYYYTDQASVGVTSGPTQYSGDVTIPAVVTYNGTAFSVIGIDTWAFTGCSDLTSVTIPNTVVSIGDFAFGECSGLNSIIVDAGNPTYDSRNNCNAIIETATNTLIAGCKNTVIPNSVTGIRYFAFNGCTGLTGLVIPNSVTYIDVKAFQNCSALRSIAIPNSVTFIGGEAFKYCSALTMVTIPNSVAYIGSEVFDDCTSLMDVYSFLTDLQGVTVGNNVFRSSGDYSGRTLHVPHGTAGAYQADRNWYPYFGQIVEMGPVTQLCGDVNADQEVNIADVMAAIDIILKGGDYTSAADVNSDGEVNIADINALIDIILNGGATLRVNCTPKV